jgi:ligand-binding sensor domain-containing protein
MQKKGLIVLVILLTISNCWGQNNIGAIGQWREHHNNQSVKNVVKGDKIYGASKYQLFSVDSKNNIEYIGKSNGLNEVGIQTIKWHTLSQQLIVAYNNSSIDIIHGDQVFGINDIQLSNLYPNNKINDISVLDKWVLLATNFGIVILDVEKKEIKDTWFPNNNRKAVITYQTATTADSLYVVTEEGLFSTSIKNNWILPNQWIHLAAFKALGIKGVANQKNTIYAYSDNSIFQLPNTQPYAIFTTAKIKQVIADTASILVALQHGNNKGSVVNINYNKTITTIVDTTILVHPTALLLEDQGYWIADSVKGLLHKTTSLNWLPLSGPTQSIETRSAINDKILITPFGNDKIGFATYTAAGWTNYTNFNTTANLPILNDAVLDSKDGSVWFTADNSLVHIDVVARKMETIVPSIVTGKLVDVQIGTDGSIWTLKEGQGILVSNKNTWNLITPPSDYEKQGFQSFLLSSYGQAWIIVPNAQGLYAYQSAQNYSTAAWKKFTTARGNGNLPSNTITCITEDKIGNIWIGTDKGVGIINCGDLTTNSCDAYTPIVTNNGFAGTLFQNTTINTIAIDGANRKWVGTNNGAWLLSSDGTTIIEHFIATTSPLPTDTITQILVDPIMGEVFFNTPQGMVSFRGTSTEAAATQESILIYPNPVAPDYSGPIAFKGLVENAMVKITDLSGRLVFQTRSLGGQAIWNGRSYEGQKIATGIYLVFVRSDDGEEKNVGKLLITNGL